MALLAICITWCLWASTRWSTWLVVGAVNSVCCWRTHRENLRRRNFLQRLIKYQHTQHCTLCAFMSLITPIERDNRMELLKNESDNIVAPETPGGLLLEDFRVILLKRETELSVRIRSICGLDQPLRKAVQHACLVLSCLIHAVAGRTFPAGERGSAAGSLLSSQYPNYTWACVLCRPSPEFPFRFIWVLGSLPWCGGGSALVGASGPAARPSPVSLLWFFMPRGPKVTPPP
jgi:hypothetical protein